MPYGGASDRILSTQSGPDIPAPTMAHHEDEEATRHLLKENQAMRAEVSLA